MLIPQLLGALVVRELQILYLVLRSHTLAVAVAVLALTPLGLAVQVGAVLVFLTQLAQPPLLAQRIQVVAVAVHHRHRVVQGVQAAQASLSFPTLAHKEAQAAQSHQLVATPFTHSHHQALTLPDLIF